MKKRQVITYIIVMLTMICTSVYATVSGDLNLVSTENYEQGKEFTVTLSLKDLQTETGLKAVEGYINIDKDVIEELTVDSIVSNNGKVTINSDNILRVIDKLEENDVSSSETGIIFNSKPVSGNGDYRIVINFAKELKENVDLLTIKFKVKSDATVGATYNNAVEYKTFRIFSDSEKAAIEDKTINITVKAKSTQNTTNDNNSSSNNTTNTNSSNIISNNTTSNNTISNSNTNSSNTTNNTISNSNTNSSNTTNNTISNSNTVKTDNSKTNSTNSTTNNISNRTYSVDSISNVESQQAEDTTVSKTPLPNTGYKLLLIPLALLVGVGLAFYTKYIKYTRINKMK